MVYEHKLPSVLNPSGDIIVPLFIPHEPSYISLLLGALSTLEQVEYYQRDSNFDDENAQVVAGQWRDRTITPLIDAIASGSHVIVNRKHSFYSVDLVTNKSTTSGVPVQVAGSNFSHTFEYPNAVIKARNITISHSLAGEEVYVEPVVSGESADSVAGAISRGTSQRQMFCAAAFSGLTLAVARTISLYWFRTNSGSGNMSASSVIIFEIEEWD
jgi:hypothetical protein